MIKEVALRADLEKDLREGGWLEGCVGKNEEKEGQGQGPL